MKACGYIPIYLCILHYTAAKQVEKAPAATQGMGKLRPGGHMCPVKFLKSAKLEKKYFNIK